MSDTPASRALAYLQAHTVVSLSTNGSEGLWAAAVFYACDGFALYFLSAEKTRHARNIASNPRVAATIQENYADWPAIQGIQLEGLATKLAGEDRQAAIALYREQYPFLNRPIPTLAAALKKVNWYCLRPDKLYFVDNTRGFGHRDEIALD
jgi:uncharacterized protein YhbP (UPF0306 family)